MHELSLARGLIRAVTGAAAKDGARAVTEVRVLIGALAHVDPEALALGFSAASRGTAAERAQLVLLPGPGRAFCVPCGEAFAVDRRTDPCPACGGYQWILQEGEELRVVDILVE